MDATLDQLRKKHPEYERWQNVWPNYRLAYTGGEEFIAQAGTVAPYRYDGATITTTTALAQQFGVNATPLRRFLRQFEGEPNAVYNAIWQRAEYINYLSPALTYFLTWLFATPPIIRPREGDETPEWWSAFERNADGSGRGLLDFAKDSLLEALLCRRSGWMLGRADSVTEKLDTDDSVILTPYRAEEIYDWQKTDCGELEWVVLRKETLRREFPRDRVRIETVTYLDQEQWTSWEITQDEKGGEELNKIGEGLHGLGRVPFVMTEIPPALWITDKLYSWQIGLFNQWTRLKNAMTLGCVLQPFIKSNEPTAASRIIGEGTLLQLRTGSGDEPGEEFGWTSPSVTPLEFIWSHYKEAVAEGYRIIHQMAMAVDAKSVASIARSGASKHEDRKSTEVILKGFGQIEADTLRRTVNLLSKVYGDGTVWTLDGFDNFNVSDPMEELTFLVTGLSSGIESATYKRRVQQKIARTVLDHEDESTMEAVDREIEEAVEAAEQAAQMAMMQQETPYEEFSDEDAELDPDENEADLEGLSATGAPPVNDAIDIDAE